MVSDEINAAGGLMVDGRRLRVRIDSMDVAGDPESAVAGARSLINRDRVVAIVGPQRSSTAIPVAEVAERSGVPMIAPMASHPRVTAGKRFVFRIAYLDSLQGTVLARFAIEALRARRAAVLFDASDEYSSELARAFGAAFRARGGIVSVSASYTPDRGGDVSRQLQRIRRGAPDVLLLPSYPPWVNMHIRASRAAGITATLLGTDSWDGVALGDRDELRPAYVTGQWHPGNSDRARRFEDAYLRRFGDPPNGGAAATYDAMHVLAEAIRRAGSVDGERVRAALASLGTWDGVMSTYHFAGNDPVRAAIVLGIVPPDRRKEIARVVEP
jgi:branched-chain amino acid transport system substrate-binding protein